ncbi:MAG TPA: phospholipase D-like domain-containing protein [Thermoanaerobaculia bacterium]|nr:phospholipase D-like domain-containing protein [Thermoanaerobaculia bacterium]
MPRRPRHLLPIPRPRAGRRLPRPLRAAFVGVRARALPDGLADPGFEDLLQEIDDGPVHRGHRVRVFTRGEEAFAAMREAIAAARREVLVESYIWRDDSTGRAFLDDLARAAARGVTVRALADALGSFGTRREFWREMERRGIEARRFHPLVPELWNQVFRDHRKILVVDRRVGFTGGMNIAEEYGSFPSRSKLSAASSPSAPADPSARSARSGGSPDEGAAVRAWRDTHVRVEGPVAWEMAVVFAEGWDRARGKPFTLDPLEVPSSPGDGARILVLDARPRRGYAEAAAVLAAIVAAARRRVWITNAYFAPRLAAVRILGAAVRHGVDVRLLLPGKTDVPLVRHAGHGYYRALLERGVRIFEYQDSILHAKSMVADGHASVVGSTNLDFRSFHFNAECNLVILDPATGRRLEEVFEEDLEGAEEISLEAWNRRGTLHKLGDRAARWLSPLL